MVADERDGRIGWVQTDGNGEAPATEGELQEPASARRRMIADFMMVGVGGVTSNPELRVGWGEIFAYAAFLR
jgi:hypothetical protein